MEKHIKEIARELKKIRKELEQSNKHSKNQNTLEDEEPEIDEEDLIKYINDNLVNRIGDIGNLEPLVKEVLLLELKYLQEKGIAE